MDLVQATWRLLNSEVAENREIHKRILFKLDQILEILNPTPPNKILFNATFDDGTTKENIVALTMTADQKCRLTLVIKNPVTGKPAPVDGVPVWASSDDTVSTVEPDVDGMAAWCVGVIQGTNRITAQADADLGEGVTNISGLLDVTITPGALPVMEIQAGTPESQGEQP